MLSAKLIAMIEDHGETIGARVIGKIRHDPELTTLRKLPEAELKEWGRDIARHLGHWLGSSEQEVARRYESVGRTRCQQQVPLHECVHGLHLVKNAILDYIRGQGVSQTTVDIYAEEELEHGVGRFFDWVVYHLVKGYEEALRPAALRAARA
ncbi:MAG: hypothetical protein FJ280_28125 [Planctomycetes bacterium]|nr:hypothetical protein [Planctomycetota bacterium]